MFRELRSVLSPRFRLLPASMLLLSLIVACGSSRKAGKEKEEEQIQTIVLPAKTQVPGAGPYGVSTANGLRYSVAFVELTDSKATFRVTVTNNSILPIAISPTDFIAFSSKDTNSETPRFPAWTGQHAMDPEQERATIDTMLANDADAYTAYLAGQARRESSKMRSNAAHNHEASTEGLNQLRGEWDGALQKGMVPSGESVRGIINFFPRREWPLVKVLVPYADTVQALIFRAERK